MPEVEGSVSPQDWRTQSRGTDATGSGLILADAAVAASWKRARSEEHQRREASEMQKKGDVMRWGAPLQRALFAALLVTLLGTGAVSALDWQNQAALSDEMDRAFATSVVAMTDEISSILIAWSDAATPDPTTANNSRLRSVGSNLSTRSRYWYDTLYPMPVSGRFAISKRSLLLGLLEFEAAGDSTVQGMDLALSGNEAAAVPLIVEAGNQVGRGGDYFKTASAQWPAKGSSAVTPAVTVAEPSPAPVTQPVVTPGSARMWGKRYTVGNPGSFLGTRAGSSTAPAGTGNRRVAASTGTVLKPGSRSYGIAPPASGSFVRWYPAARWGAGIR